MPREIEREIRGALKREILVAPHARPNTPEPTYRTPEFIESERFIINRLTGATHAVEPIATAVDFSRHLAVSSGGIAGEPYRPEVPRRALPILIAVSCTTPLRLTAPIPAATPGAYRHHP